MAGAALVTGGRRGIGRGVSLALAEAGFDVVMNDLVEDDKAAETLQLIRERGRRAAFVQADVGDLAAQDRLVEQAWAAFGSIDCLVNNAGVQVAERRDMLETTPESWDRLIGINLRAPFFLSQKAARRWLAEPRADARRSLVFLASVNSVAASTNRPEYCVSKAGVSMLTKLFALRLADAGVHVYEIRPGVIETDMTAGVREQYTKQIADGLSPIRRWGQPEDIGKAVAALASGAIPFSTGDAFHIDGGFHVPKM
jgi:NAD(P)-dependent dehydrogenase (short-subunit alcohol dehydrogenase family)